MALLGAMFFDPADTPPWLSLRLAKFDALWPTSLIYFCSWWFIVIWFSLLLMAATVALVVDLAASELGFYRRLTFI